MAEEGAEHCAVCGAAFALETCWKCMGEGGFHECGEDTCACLAPDDLDVICAECHGEGEYLVCPDAQHHPKPEPAR